MRRGTQQALDLVGIIDGEFHTHVAGYGQACRRRP